MTLAYCLSCEHFPWDLSGQFVLGLHVVFWDQYLNSPSLSHYLDSEPLPPEVSKHANSLIAIVPLAHRLKFTQINMNIVLESFWIFN